MPYATQQDLVERFGEAELVAITGEMDPVTVERALSDADAEIDGYLRGSYALPMNPVPALLKPVACDIARYRMLGSRPHEVARDRYKDAVALLKAIAAGDVQLGAQAPAEEIEIGSPLVDAPRRVFTADTLKGF